MTRRSGADLAGLWLQGSRVRAEIFDVAGRRVARLVNEQRMEAGRHSLVWDGRGRSGARLESGVYYVRVSAGPHSAETRLVLLSP
jgi:flagellar hook assembly protein FlgD